MHTLRNILGSFSNIPDLVFIINKESKPPKVIRIACQDPNVLVTKQLQRLRRK